jgi:beta-lactamase class A
MHIAIPEVALALDERLRLAQAENMTGLSPKERRMRGPLPELPFRINTLKDPQRMTEEFTPLKNKLNSLIAQEVSNGSALQISVYFDKRDGRWLSINKNEKYFPASLMKVPVLIAVLKVSEEDPNFLNKKIVFTEAMGLNDMEYFKPSKTLVVGRSYTVNELLERMIVYSDNDAVPLLLQTIDQKIFDEVFTDLGITIPGNASETLTDYMTVKTYANFFRVLNNASYLNRQTSEKALELLSRSDFASGIRAGVPVGTMVAQKFGERVFDVNPLSHKSQKELHDCGIVYFPQHPYLLCVMTKGTDFSKLEESIKTISQAVYASIQEENAQK